MRIILKPGGVYLILGSFCVLITLFLLVFQKGKQTPAVATTPVRNGWTVAQPVDAASADKKGVPLLENGDYSRVLAGTWDFSRGTPTIVKGKGPDGASQFLRLQFVPEGGHFWSVNMAQTLTKPMKKGDQVVFRGWLRSPESVVLNFFIEESSSPYGKTMMSRLPLTPEWKQYSATGTINRDYAAGEARMTIHFGVIPGAVAMSGFRLENYGPAASATVKK